MSQMTSNSNDISCQVNLKSQGKELLSEKNVGNSNNSLSNMITRHARAVICNKAIIGRLASGGSVMKRLNVLVVETFEVTKGLTSLGFRVIEADSGQVAVTMVKNSLFAKNYGAKSFELVVVHLRTIDIDGATTIANMREIGYEDMIVATVDETEFNADQESRLLESGADKVVLRPITGERLYEKVKGMIFRPLFLF